MAEEKELPPGFQDMQEFGLIEALLGRRSRRFFKGAEIPDGFFAYKSRHDPMPLSELEKLLTEFYDHFFKPGAYLRTHARHLERWHHGR